MVGLTKPTEKRSYNISEKLKNIEVNINLKVNDYQIDELIYVLICARNKLIENENILALTRLERADDILQAYIKELDKEVYPGLEDIKNNKEGKNER